MNDRTVVIDFETTGLAARGGDRAIEVGAVALERGSVVDRFQSLINPGFRVSAFIESYTGIGNAMLAGAPDSGQVMPRLREFIGDAVLVAHNASFDRGFLEAEYHRLGYRCDHAFICSMRVARRLYRDAPDHRLGTLVEHARLPRSGRFHRALADAEMTGALWLAMLGLLAGRYRIAGPDSALLHKLQSIRIGQADAYLKDLAGRR